MSEPSAITTWAVDSQVQRSQVDASGRVVEGYEIAFHTGQGHAGTIFVPMAQYTLDNVKAKIAAAAEQMDSVGNLTSES